MGVRFDQYQICDQRGGHIPSDIQTASMPPLEVCKFCGTKYRTYLAVDEYEAPLEDE